MFIIGHFFLALSWIVNQILWLMSWAIIIRAFLSWVSPDPYNSIVQFLYRVTEPILEPIRRLLPPMGIDFSPIIAVFALLFLQKFLVPSLAEIGTRFL